MKTQHISEYIIDYLEGKLPESTRSAIHSHMESCSQCRQEMEWMKSVLAPESGTHLSLPEPDPDLAERILAGTIRKQQKPVSIWWNSSIAAAATIAGIIVGNYLYSVSESVPEQGTGIYGVSGLVDETPSLDSYLENLNGDKQ